VKAVLDASDLGSTVYLIVLAGSFAEGIGQQGSVWVKHCLASQVQGTERGVKGGMWSSIDKSKGKAQT